MGVGFEKDRSFFVQFTGKVEVVIQSCASFCQYLVRKRCSGISDRQKQYDEFEFWTLLSWQ